MIGYTLVATFCLAWPVAACSLSVSSRFVSSVTLLVSFAGLAIEAFVPLPKSKDERVAAEIADAFHRVVAKEIAKQ